MPVIPPVNPRLSVSDPMLDEKYLQVSPLSFFPLEWMNCLSPTVRVDQVPLLIKKLKRSLLLHNTLQ